MKFFKKVAAAMLATVCLAGAVMPMASQATAEATYDPCDVNHDGVVNLSDVVVINKYLVGQTSTFYYAQLDANKNLIVDDADAKCVLNKITNVSYSAKFLSRKEGKEYDFPSVSSTISYPEEYESTRTYMKYDCEKKGKAVSYPLTLSSTDSLHSSGISLYSDPDGIDTRIPANGPECNGIVYNSKMGTGFVVADHVIATSAHGVYSGDGVFKDITTLETYDEDGRRDNKTLTALEIHIPFLYYKSYNPDYDYALIVVKEDLSDRTHFSLSPTYNITASNFSNVPIYVTGVADGIKDKNGNDITNTEKILYFDEGRITSAENATIQYNTDTSTGDSGAPVYTITRVVSGTSDIFRCYSAMAIHTRGGNSGTRINKFLLQFYLNNTEVNKLFNN